MKKSILLLFISLFFINFEGNSQNLTADSLALVAIYAQCDGANWNNSDNWLTAPIADWEGVKVSGNRVTELKFIGKGLKNSMPDDIYDLTGLVLFETREGSCEWTVNAEIQQLTNLKNCFINSQSTTIEDMSVFCPMPELKGIILSFVSGNINIPECLSTMGLTRLQLSNLNFQETPFPPAVANFSEMQILGFAGLGLEGEIPTEVCEMQNIASFNLNENNLSGTYPSCLLTESTLQVNIGNCGLSGVFPFEAIGSSLGIINMNGNEFTGDIGTFPNAPGTYGINMFNNKITGNFDANIFDKEWLLAVDITSNNISGLENWSGFGDRFDRLKVVNNKLNFDDLEQVDLASDVTFTYAPQKPLGKDSTYHLTIGENITLNCEAGGSLTEYQWYKDNEEIDGANEANLLLTDLQTSDVGTYICEATNEDFPDLILVTEEQILDITSSSNELLEKVPTCFPNPTSGLLEISEVVDIVAVQIFNSMGRQIELAKDFSDKRMILNLENHPTGAYFVSIITETNQLSLKVFKK